MSIGSRIRSMWRDATSSGKANADVHDEVESYVALLTAENVRKGMSAGEARRAALLATGGVEQVEEGIRDVRVGLRVGSLLLDAKQALRSVTRSPATATIVVITLALTIGANTAIYSLAHALLLEKLPYRDADRVVYVDSPPVSLSIQGSAIEFTLTRSVQRHPMLESHALYYTGSGANLEGSDAARITVAQVEPSFMATLGAAPSMGRDFRKEDGASGANHVILLSDRLWRRLGGKREIIGTSIRLTGESYSVIGVMPPAMDYPIGVEAWTPTPLRSEMVGAATSPSAIMRLRPGVTVEAATREFNSAERESLPAGVDANPFELIGLQRQLTLPVRLPLLLLLGAAVVVVVIGCANVAALLLARVSSREAEFMVRGALGAGAPRIARQVVTEALIMGAAGGGLAMVVAFGGVRILAQLFPPDTLSAQSVHLSTSALMFATVVSIACSIAFGSLPAFRAAFAVRAVPGSATVTASRRHEYFRASLVTAEIALGLVLVVCAMLLLRSLARIESVPLGMQVQDVVTARVRLPAVRYAERDQQIRYIDAVLAEVRRNSRITAAGVSSTQPFNRELGVGLPVERSDQRSAGGGPQIVAMHMTATPGYLEAIGATVLHGRDFTDADGTSGEHAFIITRAVAQTLFGTTHAAGRTIAIPLRSRGAATTKEGIVVGVVDDIRLRSITDPIRGVIIEPVRQAPTPYATIAVRTRDADVGIAALRAATRSVDSNVPAYDVRRLSSIVADAIGPRHTLPRVVSLFAALAVLLCGLGTYGLLSEVVTRQRRALCIRVALGARPAQLFAEVMRRALRLAGIGTVIGLAGGIAATRIMRSLLYGTDPLDPASFIAAPVVIALVTVLAVAPPALRAARLHAAEMLKE